MLIRNIVSGLALIALSITLGAITVGSLLAFCLENYLDDSMAFFSYPSIKMNDDDVF